MTTSNKTKKTIVLPVYAGSKTALRKSLEVLSRKLEKQGYETWINEQFHFYGFCFFVYLENVELVFEFRKGQFNGFRFGGLEMKYVKAAFMEALEAETK